MPADVELLTSNKAIATPDPVTAHPGEPLGMWIKSPAIALRVPAIRHERPDKTRVENGVTIARDVQLRVTCIQKLIRGVDE